MRMRKFNQIMIGFLVMLLLTSPVMSVIAESSGRMSENYESAFNEELLQFLIEEYGAEQAPAIFETLQQLRIVDEGGNFIHHPIYLDGKGYTLDEIRPLLEEGQVDLSQTANVDGQSLRLDTLKQMIEMEERLAALEPTPVEITPEHLDSLESLVRQAGSAGIQYKEEAGILSASGARVMSGTDGSGDYEDETIVTLTGYFLQNDERKVTLMFDMNRPQPEPVSFTYELFDGTLGSASLTTPNTGEVVFAAGETEKTIEIVGADLNLPDPFIPYPTRRDWLEQVWAKLGRADYIHFTNYKNLDEIRFDVHIYHACCYNDQPPYFPFTHSYHGGAYLAYATERGRATGQGEHLGQPLIFQYAGTLETNPETLEMTEVYARPGTYTTGQIVPYKVYFNGLVLHSLPGKVNDPKLVLANGNIATPAIVAESYPLGGYPYYGAFSYIRGYQTVVTKGMKPEDIGVVRSTGEGRPIYYNEYIRPRNEPYIGAVYNDALWDGTFTNDPDITIIPARADAFLSIEMDQANYVVGQAANITVRLDNQDGVADWIIDGGMTSEQLSKKLRVSIGDKKQGIVNMDWKRGQDGQPDSPLTLEGSIKLTENVLDLMTDAHKADGKLRAKIYYNRYPFTSGEQLEDFGLLTDMYANFTVKRPTYIFEEDLQVVYPSSWPSGTPHVVSLIDSTPTAFGYTYPSNATFIAPDQFVWSSNDEAIADIRPDGTIIPKQAGTVTFTVTARNNDELTPPTEVETDPITIDATGSAAIVIPGFANKVHVYKNHDATLVWSTNVMDRYKQLAEEAELPGVQEAHFAVELYDGFWSETELAGQTPLETWEASAHPELIDATTFTIDSSWNKDVSTGHTPRYTVRVRTQNPEQPASTLSAVAYIVVKAEPAVVTLDKSVGPYLTDATREVTFSWQLAHFDQENGGEFEFKVTKNGAPVPGAHITFDSDEKVFSDVNVSETGGEYTLQIASVDPDERRMKDMYAITLAVRNSPDSSWSYDSLHLHVYDRDALQIQVDGAAKTEHVMSNVERISQMTPDQILAQNRAIDLQNNISINYTDFSDLGEITDQIAWKSGNNAAGSIYFKSYGSIENIETYGYDSYQPKHSFVLSGMRDGQTRITATHANTGMAATLDVTVETLKDKLYLFQFYPKAKTKITYTDKLGEEKSATSNADGQLALFEENSIASDVYVTSEFNGMTYTGVVSQEMLLSQEGNAARQELYPVNILQLRQLAQVEVYFKTPDGQPYTGQIMYRGGVYKNGHYADPAEIDEQTITLGTDGLLALTLDTTRFYAPAAGEQNAANLSAQDEIEIVLEIQFEEDQYVPQLLTLDGNTSPVDMIVFGDKISVLMENTAGSPTPFIVEQTVTSAHDQQSINGRSVRFGPNNQIPHITLTTEVMWWGEQMEDERAYVELHDEVGFEPRGQSYQTFRHPFSDLYVTRHEQIINEDTIWLDQGETGSLIFNLYDSSGTFRKSMTAPARLVNMIGVKEISLVEMTAEIKRLKGEMENVKGGMADPNSSDRVWLDVLEILGAIGIETGALTMGIFPTDDPMVYRTIFSTVNFSNLPQPGPDGIGVKVFDSKYETFPGLGDLKKMKNRTYMDEARKEFQQMAKPKNRRGEILYSVGGYYLGEIEYNPRKEEWEYAVLGGGFTAGGGYEENRTWNTTVGPVPVTLTLTAGGAAEIDFKASVLYEEIPGYPWKEDYGKVPDYLTTLRLIGYAEMFGGLGFDYSVVAAKIGLFGRLLIDFNTTWLNRNYLAQSDDRVWDGRKLTLEGIAGVRVLVKLLFVSIQHDIASFRYSHSWVFSEWDNIQSYWEEHNSVPLSAANVNEAISAYMEHAGIDDFHVFETMTLENRDYLTAYDRTLANQALLESLGASGAMHIWDENAYPFSHPQVAQDGSLFVYLTDQDSAAIEDTVAAWAVADNGTYVDQGPIVTDPSFAGFGDANLHIAGEGDLIAAVWVRLSEQISKDPGEELTNADILLMNNSAEVMVAIYDGEEWTPHKLTSNIGPDLAPVVAVNEDKVFVAFRNVYAANVDHPLDFSEHDKILYTVYDTNTNEWSEVETLYNGQNGTVMGLTAAMLDNGRTAVVYTIQSGESSEENTLLANSAVVGANNEILYAVIDTDADDTAHASTWKTKGVIKKLQLTHDDTADENPQLTSATFPDGKERFILAWYATRAENGLLEHDIKLSALNDDGEVYAGFIDSLSILDTFNEVKVHPHFAFAKMPRKQNSLHNLSILWKEAEADIAETDIITRDKLKAVKFGVDTADGTNDFYLSGVLDVATMPDFTEIDSIEAFVSDGDERTVQALLLGTEYTTDVERVGTVTPKEPHEDGDGIPITVASTFSHIFTVEGTYKHRFNADDVMLNPHEIVAGYDLPIQFNLVNQGVDKMTHVTITVEGQTEQFDDVSLRPNATQMLTFYYEVPSEIKNIQYTVQVTFADDTTESVTGQLKLDIPDLGIGHIHVTAEDGKRKLSIPLYDKNDTTLAHKGRSVKLGLYKTNIYEEDHRIGDVIEITDDTELELIDNGAYLHVLEFDLQAYLAELELKEVPESGLAIFVRSWVEDEHGESLPEFDESNNEMKVLFENLAVKYNADPVLLTVEQSNTDSHTSVDLTMQNMHMTEVESGNCW